MKVTFIINSTLKSLFEYIFLSLPVYMQIYLIKCWLIRGILLGGFPLDPRQLDIIKSYNSPRANLELLISQPCTRKDQLLPKGCVHDVCKNQYSIQLAFSRCDLHITGLTQSTFTCYVDSTRYNSFIDGPIGVKVSYSSS